MWYCQFYARSRCTLLLHARDAKVCSIRGRYPAFKMSRAIFLRRYTTREAVLTIQNCSRKLFWFAKESGTRTCFCFCHLHSPALWLCWKADAKAVVVGHRPKVAVCFSGRKSAGIYSFSSQEAFAVCRAQHFTSLAPTRLFFWQPLRSSRNCFRQSSWKKVSV